MNKFWTFVSILVMIIAAIIFGIVILKLKAWIAYRQVKKMQEKQALLTTPPQ